MKDNKITVRIDVAKEQNNMFYRFIHINYS